MGCIICGEKRVPQCGKRERPSIGDGKVIYEKMEKVIHSLTNKLRVRSGGRKDPSTNGVGKTDQSRVINELKPFLSHCTKFNSKWNRPKSIMYIENNKGRIFMTLSVEGSSMIHVLDLYFPLFTLLYIL